MPVIEVHLLEGYDNDAKSRLGKALTNASRLVVPAPADAVTVMIHEMSSSNYYRGGTQRSPAQAAPDPEVIVRTFLNALENRQIDAASEWLATDFSMHFPNTPAMYQLSELVSWSSSRYETIQKTYIGFDSLHGSGDESIVYCRGTLAGMWLDGTEFSNIRFVDRFEIVKDKITRQEVWNDLGEHILQLRDKP